MRSLLVLGILLPLLGCGLAGRCEPPTDVILYAVSPYEIDPDYNPFQDFNIPSGRTTWDCEGPTRVWVLDTLDEETMRRVMIHELWHVAGFDEHLGDPSCAAHSSAGVGILPCPEELAAMERVHRTFRLHHEPDVWEVTVAAAAWWNEALGRVMFEVE